MKPNFESIVASKICLSSENGIAWKSSPNSTIANLDILPQKLNIAILAHHYLLWLPENKSLTPTKIINYVY